MSIASTAIIYPNVVLGNGVIIEDFCIIGAPSRNNSGTKTIIGANSVIRSHTVIYEGNNIGSNFQTGNKTNIRENNHIGNDVSIGTLSVIEHSTKIGNKVRIHSQSFIPEYSVLEDECWIGPNVTLTNAKYPNSPNAKNTLIGPVIKNKAIIGAHSVILPGITIETHTLIGAGSVVCKNTKAFSIYMGNPAQYIKSINDTQDYEINPSL